jgi:RNA polymerase sigma-70 factor (ECF subfamily)
LAYVTLVRWRKSGYNQYTDPIPAKVPSVRRAAGYSGRRDDMSSRSNEAWLHDLKADGEVQQEAIVELRTLLLRAALYFFSRNLSDFAGLSREEIRQRAEDCAQEALIAVLSHLQDFHGDSQFTTWAYKFAINKALMMARRERWKAVSLDELSVTAEQTFAAWVRQAKPEAVTPEQAALQNEVRMIIQEVMAHELTAKQRQVLLLMVIQDVPLDEVVRHLGTNRNAVYKLLHDARRKLKRGLQERGFEVSEILTLFGVRR